MSMVIQPARFAAAVDLGAAVQTALAGTPGFALDPTDIAMLWQNSTKTTPVVTNGDPIGAIASKWGAVPCDATASSSFLRPLWSGSNAADFDGTDDYFVCTATALLNNKPAGFSCARILIDNLTVDRHIVGLSGLSGLQPRFGLAVLTNGSIRFICRTVNASTLTTFLSPAGVITSGQAYVITAQVDYAGTRAASVWVDGVSVISGTLTQAAGNTSSTDSTRFWIGININTGERFDGRMGRMVFADKLMTAGEIASIEAWVGEGTMT